MPRQTQFDLTSLSVVKPGIDEALGIVNTRLEHYFEAPDGPVLDDARAELHRIAGVLRMIRLDGVAVYCAEIERLLVELAANPSLASPLYRSVAQNALTGLVDYLDALMQGADNAVLRLFPQYEAMQQLRGMEMSFEQDLFFPDLSVQLPNSVSSIVQRGDAAAALKTAHSRYQRGLALWWQKSDPTSALPLMQQALDIALANVPVVARAFWWVANGLLDCIRQDKLQMDIGVRKLLGRIEKQMRSIVKSDAGDDVQPVLNEMLYLISRCGDAGERVSEISRCYALDRYNPAVYQMTQAQQKQSLEEVRDQMQAAEDNWEQCVAGNREACNLFVEYIENIAKKSDKLERNAPRYLTKKIEALSVYLRDPEYARLIGEDVAMALMLWRSGMTQFETMDLRFREQARILSDQIDAAMSQKPEDANRIEELIRLYSQNEQDAVTSSLANEMLENLRLVEQGLDEFFGNVTRRDGLNRLQRLLVQIHGGLHILSLQQAEQLLLEMQTLVRGFAEDNDAPTAAQTHALAGAVNALDDYLQHLARGQEPPGLTAPLNELLALRQVSTLADAVPAAAIHDAPTAVVPAEPVSAATEDLSADESELLDVFIEEAGEVLGTLRENLGICRQQPENQDALTVIRRGFHTLKGSGRMVGLTELGEVAWAAERALNKWLQHKKPADQDLLSFIEEAVRVFAGWIDEIAKCGRVGIQAEDLVEQARSIENSAEPSAEQVIAALAAKLHQETVPAQDFAEPESVVIGEITLSPTLFRIASEEARQNVAALHRQFDEMRAHPPYQVAYDFMRAAHTLAGICRSLGIVSVVDLSAALEGWLQAHLYQPAVIAGQQLQMIETAIATIDGMVQRICAKEMPPEYPDQVELLQVDKERVIRETEAAGLAASLPAEKPEAEQLEAAPLGEIKTATVPEQRAMMRDEVDVQLLPVFLEEADDLFPRIAGGLRGLRQSPQNNAQLQALNRLLHTLKGSARMAGAMRIGEIAHAMEGRLLGEALSGEAWDALEADMDSIAALIEELRSGRVQHQEAVSDEEAPLAATLPGPVGAERAQLSPVLRVRADVVDRLVNQAGEISVARSRIETELRAFRDGLMELTGSVARLRKQLREVEIQAESQIQARVTLAGERNEQFDPLEFDRFTRLQELTRFMDESVHDVQTVQQALLKNVDETASAIFSQARLNRELQQDLLSVRMVPFSSMSERLYRLVRQTAKELNKRANLELTGSGVELDRSVLEKMTAPFEHLLRNAIAHGLEDEAARIACDKPAIGEIRLGLRQESNEVVFEFSDDGRGLDFPALRARAIEKGLLDESDRDVGDDQLAALIFASGISTADEVTEVAGRGIGMDVVRSEIAALGGRIDVASQLGLGTQFTIHLPLTLAVTQVLMVRAGGQHYAFPSSLVELVRQVKPEELSHLYTEQKVQWDGNAYPFHYLPTLLGDDERTPETLVHNPVLLLRSGNQRIALHVDELLGNREAVVKNVGPQLARLPGIAGATVLGDGSVVLILNPVHLPRRTAAANRNIRKAEELRSQPLIMVVDDSLTVRKVTQRLLMRAGYQVVTAKDGVDALEQLNEMMPAVMLLDIEMPRMDGFELTRQLRRDAKTQHLPIIMITSRTADKHREHAMQLGVDAYLGKPYQEEELLARIAGLIVPQNSV